MPALTMTRQYAFAMSVDAANRNMRKCWPRKAWNDEDAEIARETFARLWPLEAEYPWASPAQIATMKQQLGYDKL